MKEKSHKKSFVDLNFARVEEQRKVMERIIAEGKCPFCPENLPNYHKMTILKEGKYWLLTYNQWPYENTKVHLLAISKTHAENLSDLEPEAGRELVELFQFCEKEFQIPGGGFAMRFGSTAYSGGTVSHLHAQLIQPDTQKQDYKPVKFRIG